MAFGRLFVRFYVFRRLFFSSGWIGFRKASSFLRRGWFSEAISFLRLDWFSEGISVPPAELDFGSHLRSSGRIGLKSVAALPLPPLRGGPLPLQAAGGYTFQTNPASVTTCFLLLQPLRSVAHLSNLFS